MENKKKPSPVIPIDGAKDIGAAVQKMLEETGDYHVTQAIRIDDVLWADFHLQDSNGMPVQIKRDGKLMDFIVVVIPK
jgi:hypothetical protein